MKCTYFFKQFLTLTFISIILLLANPLAEASNNVKQDLDFHKFMMDKANEVDENVNTFVLDNSQLQLNDTEAIEYILTNFRNYPHGVSLNVDKINYSRVCFEDTLKCNLNFKLFYYESKSEIDEFNLKMKSFVDTLNGKSFEEKVLSITNYVKSAGDYGYADKGSAHSPLTLFNEGWGVCQAYAVATQRLLTYAGITNHMLTGLANGTEHAWNIVIDEKGNHYHLDVTWEDILNNNSYYMISTSQLDSLGTHVYESADLDKMLEAKEYYGKVSSDTDPVIPDPVIPDPVILDPVIPDPDEEEEEPKGELPVGITEFLSKIKASTYLGNLGEQPEDKSFSINFNSNVGKNYEPKVFMYHIDSHTSVPIDFTLKGKSLIVQTKTGIMDSGKYYLIILSGIESDDEPPMISKQDYYINFEVK